MARQAKTDCALQRRQLFEDSFLHLLRTRRYSEISVKEICDHAAIPRRTFYHYFESKEDLLDAVIESTMLPSFLAAMFEFDSGHQALHESFIRFFRYFAAENQDRLKLLLNNGLESRLIAYTTQWAVSEMIPLPRRADLTPQLFSLAPIIGSASFFSLLFHWCRNGYQETPEEMAGCVVWFLTEPLYKF